MTAKTKIHNQEDRRPQIRAFFEKAVINAGVGRASQQAQFADKILPQIISDIATITGQHPQNRPAKKSIAGFKIREGQTVGVRVTLRRDKMADFFERFMNIVLPRVKDFQGLKLSCVDHSGTLNIGLKEQYVFIEISGETSPFSFPLSISFVPKKKNREEAVAKYKELGVPLKKD